MGWSGKSELCNLRTTKDDNEHKSGANEEKTYYFSYFSQHSEGDFAKRLGDLTRKNKGALVRPAQTPKQKSRQFWWVSCQNFASRF